jgi:hypothetical protein
MGGEKRGERRRTNGKRMGAAKNEREREGDPAASARLETKHTLSSLPSDHKQVRALVVGPLSYI